jgi:ABC-type Fe3+ transport system substrate-binding protein
MEGHATRQARPIALEEDPPVVLHPGVPPERIAAWTTPDWLEDWPASPEHPLAAVRDPLGRARVLCVNPLVLAVDEERLRGSAPTSWSDLLDPVFEGGLALRGDGKSVCETTLLSWAGRFGDDALDGFRRAAAAADHPGRMVQALKERRSGMPPVAVLPLFFARILGRIPGFRTIWPSEGAIASPVCLRVREEATPAARALAAHLCGPEFAAVTDGLGMPSCRPGSVGVPEGNTFLWPGWEALRSGDLGGRVQSQQSRFLTIPLSGV